MKNKLSKITLLITLIAIVGFNIFLIASRNDRVELVDIKGSKEELADINIVLQQHKGRFNTKETKINKDGKEENNFAKNIRYTEKNELVPYIKENRDLFKGSHYGSGIYEDKESTGLVSVFGIYDELKFGNKMGFEFSVKDKNLKSNKIEEYTLKIGTDFEQDISVDYSILATKYNSDIYVTLGINVDPNHNEGQNYSRETYINLYKLDIDNKNVELISSKKLGNEEDKSNILSNINFEKNNIMYYAIEKKNKLELVKYRVKENHLTSTELPVNIDTEGYCEYYLEDDKLVILNVVQENTKTLDMYATAINLTNNNIESENVKYSISLENEKSNYGIENIRGIGDRIYLILNEYNEVEKINRKYVYVLDKETKEILYTGELETGSSRYYYKPYLLTDEEI